jgi:MFS family permease
MPNINILTGLISMTIEAYNLALYPFLAPHLASLLFINKSNIFAYGLLFLGSFFAAPASAIFYGSLGDTKGRKKSCIISAIGLAVTTAVMGLVPIFKFSWLIFLLLIGLQKFFSMGEYYISAIFAIEHGKKKGSISGLGFLFSVLGIILSKIMAESAISWRILFLTGAIGSFISYVFKHHCQETPAFLKTESDNVPLGAFIRRELRNIIKTVVVISFFGTIYAFLFYFLPLVTTGHIAGTLISLVLYGIMLLISGVLADKISLEKTMTLGLICIILSIFPVMILAKSQPIPAMIIITIFACIFIGPLNAWMAKQFAPEIRCRGVMISSAIKKLLSSHITTPLCLIIYESSGSLVLCGLYPFIMAILALAALHHSKIFKLFKQNRVQCPY